MCNGCYGSIAIKLLIFKNEVGYNKLKVVKQGMMVATWHCSNVGKSLLSIVGRSNAKVGIFPHCYNTK